MVRRIILLAGLVSLFLAQPVSGATARQVRWEELASAIIGKTVSIAMPAGAVVQGRAIAVTTEHLEMDVSSSSNAALVPKGSLRVPRADVHTVELHTKGVKFRVISTTLGGIAGFVGGAGVYWAIDGLGRTTGGGQAALVGVTAGGTIAGYAIGNAADRKTVTLQIGPVLTSVQR